MAVAAVAVITGAIYGLRELVPVVSTGVVYLLAVLLVSTAWGLWLGLLTAVLSAAAFNFFHIPPTGEFTIADGENWVALVVFLVAAAVVSGLSDLARSRADEAERRRGEADLAAEMARILLGGTSLDSSLRTVGQRIAAAFDLGSVGVELAWVDSDERRRALPLLVEGSRIGTVLVPRDTGEEVMEALQDRVLPALETLVGAARKRDELEAQVIETKALRRSNVVKTAVLRSVSHDLRSPLTAITAAAGGLESDTLSPEARAELASVIATESTRLSRLVDNLLDLSRLQAGGVEPRVDWASLDEVVRVALESVQAPPGGFDVQLDAELPLLRVDAAQIERALANVLDNAARYAGDGAGVDPRARHRDAAAAADRRPRPGHRPREARAGLRALPRQRRARRQRPRAGHRARLPRGERGEDPRRVAPRPGDDDRHHAAGVSRAARRGRMNQGRRVLVCDDEPQILRALRVILRDAGFEVVTAQTAQEALDAAALRAPDAAILDLILPDGNGIDVCRSIREWSEMPILVLSAVGEETEKIRALDAGADDYVTKPFAPGELIARLNAALRRAGPAEEPSMSIDGLEVDLAGHRVSRQGEEIHLTPKEFDLLRVLARNRGRLMTHRALLGEVWGHAYEEDTHTLRVHIANLRRKIEPDPGAPRYIRTDPGIGYRFAAS